MGDTHLKKKGIREVSAHGNMEVGTHWKIERNISKLDERLYEMNENENNIKG